MELGLQAAEFFAMTPRQFDALARAQQAKRTRETEHAEYLAAQITAMVANTGFRSWPEPRQPVEFMPSRRQEKPRPPRINRKAVAEKLRAVMGQLMARQAAEQQRSA